MDDTKKASRVEWLCAAMIDFIPAVLFYYLDFYLCTQLCLCGTLSVLAIPLAVYILLKDYLFDGRSWGKRFVDIRIVWPEDSDKSCLIYRNLPLSLMVLLWGLHDVSQFFELPSHSLILGFVLYMWADLICVALKGKTLGDCLAHTSLEVSGDPNYVLHKSATKRIACLVIVLILSLYEALYISPSNIMWLGGLSNYLSFYYYVEHMHSFFAILFSLYVFYKIIRDYLQNGGIDVVVVVLLVIILIVAPAINSLSKLFLLTYVRVLYLPLVLLHIVAIMFPVVCLCRKIIRRKNLRWIIYVLALSGLIIGHAPNVMFVLTDL